MEKDKDTKKKKRPSSFGYMFRRMFFGGADAKMTAANERYDSPSKLAVKRFFRKPLATGAVIVLLAMFLFVLIGPLFAPVDLSYIDPLHTNVAPTMNLMHLPDALKTNAKSITSNGTFTLGLSESGKVYVWGYYNTFSTNPQEDVMQIPEAVQNSKIAFAAAGYDHCIAIGEDGTVYGWGEYNNGQYGRDGRMTGLPGFVAQPDELIDGKIDVAQVAQLICGNQATAILMQDGTFYAWGNSNSGMQNLASMQKEVADGKKFKKICFTNTDMFAITEDGLFVMGKNRQYALYQSQDIYAYIGDRKVVDIAATGDSLALLLDDSEILSMGTAGIPPVVPEGEIVEAISAGTRHFTLMTASGKVIAWGNGKLGQTDVPKDLQEAEAVDTVFASGFQNYAYKDGIFVGAWGLKGYLMGTDDMGRDVFNRLMNGGRMTMTIGAVAVIVASVIGIVIGCLSGYLGGTVDLILMRVTEIFSAIPFLPFALVLSAVLQGSSLKEEYRIFIIMIILGLLSWTGLATMVRGQILAEREKEYVLAAKAMGVKQKRIAFQHILPNVISVILVSLTLNFATCMLTESSLSYLGFGVKLPRPTWGNMLDGCRDSVVIQNYWWRWLFPAIFLAITVICINVIGDALRDVLDPKSEVEK